MTKATKPKQYDPLLAERVEVRITSKGLTDVKKMMGGIIFMVNGKMCIGVDKDRSSSQDRLMVRVGKAPYDKLLFKHGSREMDFTGKVMRGFLFVGPEGFDTNEALDFWIAKALEFNHNIAPSKKK